jgi:hypothetical protein
MTHTLPCETLLSLRLTPCSNHHASHSLIWGERSFGHTLVSAHLTVHLQGLPLPPWRSVLALQSRWAQGKDSHKQLILPSHSSTQGKDSHNHLVLPSSGVLTSPNTCGTHSRTEASLSAAPESKVQQKCSTQQAQAHVEAPGSTCAAQAHTSATGTSTPKLVLHGFLQPGPHAALAGSSVCAAPKGAEPLMTVPQATAQPQPLPQSAACTTDSSAAPLLPLKCNTVHSINASSSSNRSRNRSTTNTTPSHLHAKITQAGGLQQALHLSAAVDAMCIHPPAWWGKTLGAAAAAAAAAATSRRGTSTAGCVCVACGNHMVPPIYKAKLQGWPSAAAPAACSGLLAPRTHPQQPGLQLPH